MKIFKRFRSTLTPDERKKNHKEWLSAVLSGVFLGISFPPLPFYSLSFVALVPLLVIWQKRKGLAEINRVTYLFGFVFSGITLYWVGSWQPETDPFLMISGVALLFFNPILFLIPSTLFHITRKKGFERLAYLLLPFFWVTYEYLYSITDLKFPWLTLGHGLAQFKSFIQAAELIGAHGISFLIVAINVCIVLFVLNYRSLTGKLYLVAGVILILVPIIYGNIRLNNYQLSEKKIKIGLVQPNLNPWKKWEIGNIDQYLDLYLSLSDEAVNQGAEIIVWPETALPVYFLSGSYFQQVNRVKQFTSENKISVLSGMPHANFYHKDEAYPPDAKPLKQSDMLYTSYNSVLLFDPNKEEVKQYGKIMLVPFGELVPFLDVLPVLGDIVRWNVGISSWNVGKDTTVFKIPFYLDGQQVDTVKTAGIICIESIYSDFVARFVQRGAELIAVVTNDSWYGDSSGPYQHEEISVLRAVENRRSVVRAANGGISCLIDPLGNILQETRMYTRDVITVEASIEKELTFFTEHPLLVIRVSYIISMFLILYAVWMSVVEKFRTRKNNEQNN